MSIVVQLCDAVFSVSCILLLLVFAVEETQSHVSRVDVLFEVEAEFLQLIHYFVDQHRHAFLFTLFGLLKSLALFLFRVGEAENSIF